MVDAHPGTNLPPKLVEYWIKGEGAAKVSWGKDGDFDRCRVEINAAIVKGGKPPLPSHEISGLCNTLHVIATGERPGHAPGESTGHKH